MSEKEGDLLKKWVESKGYKTQQIADILGLSARTSVYYVYKQQVLTFDQKELLSKVEFNIEDVRNLSQKESDTDLKKIIKDQRITLLEQKVKLLEYQVNCLLENKNKPIKKIKHV